MPDERSERAQVRSARRSQAAMRRTQLTLIAQVMAQPAGREYFYTLLGGFHLYDTSFRTNALAMAFSEGERNAGLILTNDLIEANPDAYLLMLKEQGNVRHRPDADPDPDARADEPTE